MSDWLERGNRCYREGDLDGAIECYEAAIAAEPASVRAHYNLGLVLQGRERVDEAIAHYRLALATDPAFCPALVNLANALAARGDSSGARDLYARALAIDPNDVHAIQNLVSLARLHEGRGEPGEALECYRIVVRAQPAHAVANHRAAEIWIDWGNLAYEEGDPAKAVTRFEQALESMPNHPRALHNLATVESAQGRLDRARILFERAMAAGNAESHLGLANVQAASGELESAVESYGAVVASSPGNALAHYQMGLALQKLGRFGAALGRYRDAARLRIDFFQPVINAAEVLVAIGDLPAAEEMYRRGLESPEAGIRARAAFGLGQVALRRQDFDRGWLGYEERLDIEKGGRDPEREGVPRLREADLGDSGRVAVWLEQGVGDQILFSTLLPELAHSGAEVIVEVDPRLLVPFRRSLPSLRFEEPSGFARSFGSADFQVPIGSLPALFRRSRESFSRQPASILEAESSRVADVKRAIGGTPSIGIAWRSIQPLEKRFLESNKSAALEGFGGFDGSGAILVDLQYGDVENERNAFDERHPGLRRSLTGLDLFNDLDGLLAAIAACDQVVTTSNVTAHLAGALGKKTWLMYRAANPPFHYWVPGPNGRSLWYPSVEIVTDPSWTTWEMAFEAIARRWREQDQ